MTSPTDGVAPACELDLDALERIARLAQTHGVVAFRCETVLALIELARRSSTPSGLGEGGAPPASIPLGETGELVRELRELRAFLDGSADMEGVSFGEYRQGVRGAFWWRKRLTRIDQAIEHLQALASKSDRVGATTVGTGVSNPQPGEGVTAAPATNWQPTGNQLASAPPATPSLELQEPSLREEVERNFLIAYWSDDYGWQAYSYNGEVMGRTQEDADEALNYVQKRSPDKAWEIVWIPGPRQAPNPPPTSPDDRAAS